MRTNPVMTFRTTLALAAVLASGLAYADGHCEFNQYAPVLQAWYRACAVPATQETCNTLQADRNRSDMAYAEGNCPGQPMPGACVFAEGTIYYYEGAPDDFATGCQRQGGSWHADQVP